MRLDLQEHIEMGSPPVEIKLDGNIVKYAIMADEENGVVEAYHPDLKVDSEKGIIERVKLEGKVEIKFLKW